MPIPKSLYFIYTALSYNTFMKMLSFVGGVAVVAMAGAAGMDASAFFPLYQLWAENNVAPGDPLPFCQSEDGCEMTHSIYKEGVSYSLACYPLFLMDHQEFYYECDRYQCDNGHYYNIAWIYGGPCTWGPDKGVPPTCPNNSCLPPQGPGDPPQ